MVQVVIQQSKFCLRTLVGIHLRRPSSWKVFLHFTVIPSLITRYYHSTNHMLMDIASETGHSNQKFHGDHQNFPAGHRNCVFRGQGHHVPLKKKPFSVHLITQMAINSWSKTVRLVQIVSLYDNNLPIIATVSLADGICLFGCSSRTRVISKHKFYSPIREQTSISQIKSSHGHLYQ